MDFFTADHHFGHDNIRRYCNRPFASVEEMDETLIENWNRIVKPNDRVFHLGDFCFQRTAEAAEYRYQDRLHGRIHLIRGNHDRRVSPVLFAEGIDDLFVYKHRDVRIVLCHYALRVWDRSHFNVGHLYGHSHGTLPGQGKSFDVGVDTQDFVPRSLDEVVEMLRACPDNLNLVRGRS